MGVTNTSVPFVRLASTIYARVIKRGSIIDEHSSRAGFAAKRSNGEKNIDMWVDGSLYQIDPAASLHRCFSTLKEYLESLCHGKRGMLEYQNVLAMQLRACNRRPVVMNLTYNVFVNNMKNVDSIFTI